MGASGGNLLVDRFGRQVNYLRISVTDRCDFRCVYCMAEEMTFVPRKEILSLEELALVCRAFVELGVNKIRLTGGEPLVRKNIQSLVSDLSLLPGLKELSLTSNGSQLSHLATPLFQAGLNRINISLDTLNPEKFKDITRTGNLEKVLSGIEAAKKAGFNKLKLNSVILKGRNDDEILDLAEFAVKNDYDLTFIEEMPLGYIDEHERDKCFISSEEIRARLSSVYKLDASPETSGGPARYYYAKGESTRFGFISPHSENFCSSCNRVRVTAEGCLLLCLGNEHSIDLRAITRKHPGDVNVLKEAIVGAMALKPERHHFNNEETPQIVRFMNATGG
ncbi:MAG: GTP 3',8-cyclase MoaA [Cycloclasticus sp.]|jgi:cyclic pyranopterin phosphate synthase|nr:GTP 3',8-cyclase MoaA [Cycloclasticus sp.]